MSRSPDHWVPKVAVVLAVLGTATIGWLAFGNSDGSDMVAVEMTESEITAATEVVPETTTTIVETTVIETTTVPAVIETTTIPPPPPETTVPPPPPPPPPPTPGPTPTPAVPNPEVFSGFGSHQVMNDPLLSGVPSADVKAAFATAQRVADLLAAGDWTTVRPLIPNDANDDATLSFTYGPSERISLLLLDARPDGSGFILVMGAVTNETALNQTSLRCFTWYADATAVDIVSETLVDAFQNLLMSPEGLRNSPADDARIRAACL